MSDYHMFTNDLENSTVSYILAADISGKHAKNLTKEDPSRLGKHSKPCGKHAKNPWHANSIITRRAELSMSNGLTVVNNIYKKNIWVVFIYRFCCSK